MSLIERLEQMLEHASVLGINLGSIKVTYNMHQRLVEEIGAKVQFASSNPPVSGPDAIYYKGPIHDLYIEITNEKENK